MTHSRAFEMQEVVGWGWVGEKLGSIVQYLLSGSGVWERKWLGAGYYQVKCMTCIYRERDTMYKWPWFEDVSLSTEMSAFVSGLQ